ncbi:hypothetical protein WJX77_004222 [Trebouxia sp. C0004]
MLVMCNVSFNTVDSAWFRRFCGTIRPGFAPRCASTMQWISEQLIIVLEEFGPENFGAVVSDNGGGCENGRKLTKEKYPHLAIPRCMMHGFALIMGSVFGHSWAVNILKQCQKLRGC